MDDCIFCKIANKEIPTTLVYEDDLVAAFNDLSPQAPVHVLIVPKKHYQSVLEVPEGDAIVAHMFHVASKLAKELGIAEVPSYILYECGKARNICRNIEIFNGTYRYKCYLKYVYTP